MKTNKETMQTLPNQQNYEIWTRYWRTVNTDIWCIFSSWHINYNDLVNSTTPKCLTYNIGADRGGLQSSALFFQLRTTVLGFNIIVTTYTKVLKLSYLPSQKITIKCTIFCAVDWLNWCGVWVPCDLTSPFISERYSEQDKWVKIL